MRHWLKTFLAIVAVLLGASALWVWAATLTGPAGRNVVFTATNTVDVPILLQNGVAVKSQSDAIRAIRANQSLAAATVIQHASRTDIIEQVLISSTGGAITSTASPLRIAAGVLNQMIQVCGTSASATYTIPDGNGVKLQSATPILFDDRTCMFFGYDVTGGTWRQAVTGVGGGGGGGTATSTSFSPTGGISAINVQTALTELDSEAEKLANKNANGGYLGLTSTGDAIWDRDGFAAAPALSVNSQIDANTLQVRTIGIENAGTGNLLLNGTGNPRITGCTTATGGTGRNGTRLVLRGTHATKTVTLPTGNGVKLAGNTGSVIVGANLSSVEFECNETDQVWAQVAVPSAQQVFNVGSTVATYTCGNALNFKLDAGGGTSQEFCVDATGAPAQVSLVAGAPTDHVVQLSAGKKFRVMKADGTTEIFSITEAGAVTGLSAQQSITGNLIGLAPPCGTTVPEEQYFALSGRSGGSPFGESSIQNPWPFAQTLTRLRVRNSQPVPAGETATYTIRKNAVDTALTCAIAAAGTTCTGTTAVSVAQNDLMSLQLKCVGNTTTLLPASTDGIAWGITAQ